MTQDYIKSLRRIIKVGNAHYLNLPMRFIKKHNLKKGDKLLVHGNNALTIQVIDNAKGD